MAFQPSRARGRRSTLPRQTPPGASRLPFLRSSILPARTPRHRPAKRTDGAVTNIRIKVLISRQGHLCWRFRRWAAASNSLSAAQFTKPIRAALDNSVTSLAPNKSSRLLLHEAEFADRLFAHHEFL